MHIDSGWAYAIVLAFAFLEFVCFVLGLCKVAFYVMQVAWRRCRKWDAARRRANPAGYLRAWREAIGPCATFCGCLSLALLQWRAASIVFQVIVAIIVIGYGMWRLRRLDKKLKRIEAGGMAFIPLPVTSSPLIALHPDT